MDPGSEERTLASVLTCFCPQELDLLEGLGDGRHAHTHSPRLRAATESVLVHAAMEQLNTLLDKDGLLGGEHTHGPWRNTFYNHPNEFSCLLYLCCCIQMQLCLIMS